MQETTQVTLSFAECPSVFIALIQGVVSDTTACERVAFQLSTLSPQISVLPETNRGTVSACNCITMS